jgi:dTDP-D-glucose 4,6-dehydratase
VNIGSTEMVTINQLVSMVCEIAGKRLHKRHINGPTGVRGRNSDNRLIERTLGWKPSTTLVAGLEQTYGWIEQQVRRKHAQAMENSGSILSGQMSRNGQTPNPVVLSVVDSSGDW